MKATLARFTAAVVILCIDGATLGAGIRWKPSPTASVGAEEIVVKPADGLARDARAIHDREPGAHSLGGHRWH